MFKSISIKDLNINPLTTFDQEWCLISVKDQDKINTMTASWGGLGTLWNLPVATIYVRQSRYTYQFLMNSSTFTLAFFPKKHRQALTYLGTVSGRDGDKIKTSGLQPIIEKQSVYFEEASLVIECRKIYFDAFEPTQICDQELHHRVYPNKQYHTLFIGEVVNVKVKEEII